MNEKNDECEPDEEVCVEEMEAQVTAPSTTIVRQTLFRGGVLSALGHRDYSILWSGALLSNVGTWIHITVLLWLVKELTGSNTWVGAVNLASYLPVLIFAVYAGSVADHLDRKKLIIATQTAMMIGALALAVSIDLGLDSMALIVTVTAFMGVAFVFNFPAWLAIVPDLVPKEDLLNGIALNSAQFNLARFIGPGIGAMILGVFSAAAAFYVNAVSFLAVIGALLLVRTKTPPYPKHEEGTRKHIMEAIRYVREHRWATNVLLIIGIASFFGLPYIILTPAMAKDVLGRGEAAYGWLLVLSGLGAVIGAPLVTLMNRSLKEKDIIKLATTVFGSMLIAFSLSRTYWLSLVIAVGLGASFLVLSSAINTVLQARVERDIRGRIMSFYVLMMIGLFPIGGQLMGVLADVRSAPFALFIGGCAILLLAASIIFAPGLIKDAVTTAPAE